MVKFCCFICSNFYSRPDQFKTCQSCGSALCTSCIDNLFTHFSSTHGKCPQCRVFLDRFNMQPIRNLEAVDQAYIGTTVKGLGKMNAESPLISVERGAQKVDISTRYIELEDLMGMDVAEALRVAVDDFRQRIVPAFKEQGEQIRELAELKERLEQKEEEARSLGLEALRKDKVLRNMEVDMIKLQEDHDNALSFASGVTQELLELREAKKSKEEEKEGLQKSLEERVKELESEKQYLKGLLQEHGTKSRVQKEKTKALKRELSSLQVENAQLKSRLEDAEDDSLIVRDDFIEDLSSSPQIRTHYPPSLMSSSPVPDITLTSITNKKVKDLEGMPKPGFSSDFRIGFSLGKRKNEGPLKLDRNGKPANPVHIGPKRSRRVP